MKLRMKAGAAVLYALICLDAGAEVARTKERTYLVKYKDGVAERYKIVWSANVTTTLRDEGGSFVPYQGAEEKRGCSWTIASTVERTVALATRLGPTVPLPAMSRTFKGDPRNPGADFVVTGKHDSNCRDSAARRESQIGNARSAMLGAFDALAEADLDTLKREAQSKADVATVTIE